MQGAHASGAQGGTRASGGCAAENAAKEAVVLALDERGMIRDCNRAGEALFQYRRSELVWRHVSLLLPELEKVELIQNGEPNSRLRYLVRIGRRFRARARDGECFASELYLNVLDNIGVRRVSLIVRPADDEVDRALASASRP